MEEAKRRQTPGGIPKLPRLCGEGLRVPILGGKTVRYIDLDSAATTPPFLGVVDAVNEFMSIYGSVNRGSGFKSRIATWIHEQSADEILRFVGAPPAVFSVIWSFNTTGAINKLARLIGLAADDLVVVSEYEHSANDLPWRGRNRLARISTDAAGVIDLDALDLALESHARGRKVLALTAASNITGAITPLVPAIKIARRHGALVVLDAAQLVAHRQLDLKALERVGGVDFLCFSGHKMYAPYGAGVIVGRQQILSSMRPDDLGGGNIDFATPNSFDVSGDRAKRWATGTPNAAGAVAMAASCRILRSTIGFGRIVREEQKVLDRAAVELPNLKDVSTFVDLDYKATRKCPVFPFSIDSQPPGLVAARLSYEFGIGVRFGPICQFPYVAKLLGISSKEMSSSRAAFVQNDPRKAFGIVRASFGLSRGVDEMTALAEALQTISADPGASRRYDVFEGRFEPRDKTLRFRPQVFPGTLRLKKI